MKILAHAVFFVSVISPLLATLHDRTQEPRTSKLHESRARTLSHRARLRQHSQTLLDRLRNAQTSVSNRAKRQQEYQPQAYPNPYPQQIPQAYPQPPKYSEEEPVLVHICSAEGSHEYARCADDDDSEEDTYYARANHLDNEDQDHLLRQLHVLNEEGRPRNAEIPEKQQTTEDGHQSSAPEPPEINDTATLRKALDDLKEVKEMLDEFEQENSKSPLQQANSLNEAEFLLRKSPEHPLDLKKTRSSIDHDAPIAILENPHKVMQKMRLNLLEEDNLPEDREADPHLHSHSKIHTHQKIHIHGHNVLPHTGVLNSGFPPQSHQIHPGPQIPATQIFTPGFNLNINQNQGLHSANLHNHAAVTQGFSQPNHGVFTPTQPQSVFHPRKSGSAHLDSSANLNLHNTKPILDQGFSNNFQSPNVHKPSIEQNQGLSNQGFKSLTQHGAITLQGHGFSNQGVQSVDQHEPVIPKGHGLSNQNFQSVNQHSSVINQGHGLSNQNFQSVNQHSSIINQGHGLSNQNSQSVNQHSSIVNQGHGLSNQGFQSHKAVTNQGHGLFNQDFYSHNHQKKQHTNLNLKNDFNIAPADIQNLIDVIEEERFKLPDFEKENIHNIGENGERKADPTLHKLKKKSKLVYYPQYREDEDEDETDDSSNIEEEGIVENRKAEPTLKKIKRNKKGHYYSSYPGTSHSEPYREAEVNLQSEEKEDATEGKDSSMTEPSQHLSNHDQFKRLNPEIEDNLELSKEDDTVGKPNPTIKKLLKKKMPFYYYYYPAYDMTPDYHNQYSGRYREAEQDENNSNSSENIDSREASPTLKKLKKKKIKYLPVYYPQYPSYNQYYSKNYREAEEEVSREADNTSEERITSPFLFNVPATRRFSDQYKRSVDQELDTILGTQREMIDSLKEKSKNDEDLKFVMHIGNTTLTDVENRRKNITKRSLPLTRLIHDPNAKLDVPKTIENFGTATKNAFEDDRAPMYHVKNMVGSSKNALFSAMKIPPYNMVIPSDYEIVKTSDRVGSIDPTLFSRSRQEQEPYDRTFKRVGEIVRNSIKSGQETFAHIGDVAHSARNVLHSARHSAPRLIVPYIRAPEVQDTRRNKRPNKAVLVTPRIWDITHESRARNSGDGRPNFVRLGHLMDAIGVSSPNSKKLSLQKIILEPHKITEIPVDERLAEIYNTFRGRHDDDVHAVSEAISTLEDAKISVGAKNLRDFLVKMKNQLTGVSQTPDKHKKKKYKSKSMKKQETKEMGKFIENLFDSATVEEKKKDETVGAGLFLTPELRHPFMGRPSETELRNFLQDNGNEGQSDDKERDKQKPSSPNVHFESRHGVEHNHNNSNLGYVLRAVNPLMFERLYNETVTVRNNDVSNTQDLFERASDEDGENSTLGTYFAPNEPMLTPLMDQSSQNQISELPGSSNEEDGSG